MLTRSIRYVTRVYKLHKQMEALVEEAKAGDIRPTCLPTSSCMPITRAPATRRWIT
jgi:hypothetical protein